MRVLNIFPTANNGQVRIVYVETLTKTNILNLWVESRAYPDRYILADASDINELQQDVSPNEVTTLSEYLESKNIEVNKSDFHKLANLIVKLYKIQYMSNPRKIARKDTQGRFLKKSYAYYDDELWVIEEALKKIPHTIGCS